MPRPQTKDELLAAASDQFNKLQNRLTTMSVADRAASFAFEDRDRCVRDVLVHLFEWHQMLLAWLDANLAGGDEPFLPAPYNWKTYGELNVALWERHRSTPLATASGLLIESHAAVLARVAGLTNEQLFERGQFSWTGSTTLGSYCVSVTSSHYDWALKKLAKHLKTRPE